jgi:hypothetical protein
VEPARLGTPRGAPVGFSRKKLAAALLTLTSRDVKRTAKDLGVSYGVLRKWRSEGPFKALVKRLEDEFVERFCRAVDAEVGPLALGPPIDAGGPAGSPGASTPAPDAGRPRPAQPWSGPSGADVDQIIHILYARRAHWFETRLGDLGLYGPRLIGKLARRLLDEGDGAGRLGRMSVLQGLAELRHQAAPSPELQQLGVSAQVGIVRFIVRALGSPTISDEHRRLAQVYLGMLQWQLAERQA